MNNNKFNLLDEDKKSYTVNKEKTYLCLKDENNEYSISNYSINHENKSYIKVCENIHPNFLKELQNVLKVCNLHKEQ